MIYKINKVIYGSLLLLAGIMIGIYISNEIAIAELSKNIEKASESPTKLLVVDLNNIYYVKKWHNYIYNRSNITIEEFNYEK